MLVNEYFANLKGYEDIYMISNYGTIKSTDRYVKNKNGYRKIYGKILKARVDKYGYLRIGLMKNKKQKHYLVHRLVAETFIPNPDKFPIINHKDGNKLNNHISNLEWCNQSYNIIHAYKAGLKVGKSAKHNGIKNPNSKLNEEEVLLIFKDKKNNANIKESYLKYKNKISFKGFEQIWYGYSWKKLVEKVDDKQ